VGFLIVGIIAWLVGFAADHLLTRGRSRAMLLVCAGLLLASPPLFALHLPQAATIAGILAAIAVAFMVPLAMLRSTCATFPYLAAYLARPTRAYGVGLSLLRPLCILVAVASLASVGGAALMGAFF
jgi:hypothetical protein